MYLISPLKKQYKANLHCHSVFSDGKKTPYELKEMYKDKGYSILSITDHETPKNHSYLSDSDFLAITGYETYVRPNADCRYDVYDKEIHINLFSRDPQNEAIVCYNSKYCKYITDEQKVSDAEQEKINLNIILEAIRECTDLKELTHTLVNTLIKRIEVHNSTKDEHGHKHVPIDIYFTAVGIINIPTEEELIAAMEEMREKPLKSA